MDPRSSSSAQSSSSWIDRRCDQFERDWREGREPRIEDALAATLPELHPALLRELLAIEIELRGRRGDTFSHDEYRQRFPDHLALLDDLRALFARSDTTHAISPGQASVPDRVATGTHYRDLRLYRRGGLGSLYRAQDAALHREAVVKFMSEAVAADADLVAQFKVEAEVTSRLDHPGIVPVYGIGEDPSGRPFYVMRLIHGRELREAIQEFHESGGPGRADAANRERLCSLLEHLIRACNTVAYAHHAGIVHCDLKPANIMIGKYGETFVLDWGMATSFERTSTFYLPNQATIRLHTNGDDSTNGCRGGTYGYISPEQLDTDQPLGPASDVYSLGATLYEILTGQPPFQGKSTDVQQRIRRGDYPPPRTLQPRVCVRLEAICRKAMQLDPRARYVTAKQLASDLTNWLRGDEILALPDRPFDRLARKLHRHRSLTVACFLSLLTILVAAGWIDRSLKTAAHEKALREKSEALRALEERSRDAERVSFTTALDTFEDLCRPFANGEMSNLAVFRPFVDKIRDFTAVYLDKFEQVESMRLNTGRVYELRGIVSRVYTSDTAQAVADFQRAESLYQAVPAANGENAERDLRLAQVRLGQGRLLLDREEFDQALRVLETAESEFERLRKQDAQSVVLLRQLAEAHHCLGQVYLDRPSQGTRRAQDLRDAENHFVQSRELRAELVRRSKGDENRNHVRDLARSLGYLGDLYLAQGDIPQATAAYEASKELRENLYRTGPRDPEHRFQYARGLTNFGWLELGYRGQLGRAIEQLEKAQAIQRDLTSDFDEVEQFWSDLGNTQNLLAEAYLLAAISEPARGAELRKRSRESAESANAIFGRLVRQKDPNGLPGLAESTLYLALLQTTEDPAECRRLAERTVQWLSDRGPESVLSGGELVTLAMARSLLGQGPLALRSLQEAVERGENTAYRFEQHAHLAFRHLAADPELGPQFAELLRQVRDRLKS